MWCVCARGFFAAAVACGLGLAHETLYSWDCPWVPPTLSATVCARLTSAHLPQWRTPAALEQETVVAAPIFEQLTKGSARTSAACSLQEEEWCDTKQLRLSADEGFLSGMEPGRRRCLSTAKAGRHTPAFFGTSAAKQVLVCL